MNKKSTPASRGKNLNPPKTKSGAHILAHVQGAHYSGPIPPPGALEHYESISPGSANRIILMAEEEAKHTHKMNEKIFNTKAREVFLGQIIGFVVVTMALCAACFAVAYGDSTTASVIGGSTIIALATVFVKGRGK